MTRFRVLVFLIFLNCCGPARDYNSVSTIPNDWPTGTTIQVENASVTCPAFIPTDAVARISSAVALQIDAWESDNNLIIPPTRIGIVTGNCACDGGTMLEYAGCWRGGPFIVATEGQNFDCWPVYHELCHRVFGLKGHTDPRWVIWNQRTAQLKDQFDALGR